MWATDTLYQSLIAGDHQVGVQIDAQYDGETTVSELPVTACTITRSWDGTAVRATVDATIDDDNGTLQPLLPSDPLATAGQELVVNSTVGLSAQNYSADAVVPEGIFRIQSPESTGRWWRYKNKEWLPTGGEISLQGVDLITNLQRMEILGVMQPLPGATVRSEIQRLCQSRRVPVDVDSIPDTAVGSLGVYPQDALEAVTTLLDLVELVPAMGRDGTLTALSVSRKTTPDLLVTPDSGRLVDSWIKPDDDKIRNIFAATGEGGSGSSLVRGDARENVGPYRSTGPFGWVIERISSPLYLTNTQATRGAATALAKHLAGRELVAQARLTYDPSIDVLDTHKVWFAPGLVIPALVTGTKYSPDAGGDMEVTYAVSRQEVETWIRQR